MKNVENYNSIMKCMVLCSMLFLSLFTMPPVFAQGDEFPTEMSQIRTVSNPFLHSNLYKENNIAEILQMRIELSHDTVTFGQEFYISLIFENLSDSSVKFYPKGGLYIYNYHADTSNYPLYEMMNATHLRELKAGGSTREIYTVVAQDFFRNANYYNLEILYLFSKYTKKKEKKYNTLYGMLKSAPFKVYVK